MTSRQQLSLSASPNSLVDAAISEISLATPNLSCIDSERNNNNVSKSDSNNNNKHDDDRDDSLNTNSTHSSSSSSSSSVFAPKKCESQLALTKIAPPEGIHQTNIALGTKSSVFAPITTDVLDSNCCITNSAVEEVGIVDSNTAPNNFEGPEKCLEVDFCVGSGPHDGLRSIVRQKWDNLLRSCGCEIISVKSNSDLDSYVLSESSMFVYRWKLILKTCGKTSPLRAIEHLQQMCTAEGFEMEWMGFSRKNYIFPSLQVWYNQESCFGGH